MMKGEYWDDFETEKLVELYKKGWKPYQIAKEITTKSQKSIWNKIDRMKKNGELEGQTEHKTGKEERKPQVVTTDDGYIITSSQSKRRVEITKDQLRRIKELYCDDQPLTITNICRDMEIPRGDFYLIKTAFGIVHDEIPVIDEDLINGDIEELTEAALQRKKKKFETRLQQKEIEQAFAELAVYRKQDYVINKIGQIVADHLKEFSSNYEGPMIPLRKPEPTGKMLEVSIVDLHLGKLAWEPETGENYDHKIAEKRFMSVIYDIVERIKDHKFEKILFPFGNDFYNFDTIEGTTTAGTRQDNDVRWQKLFAKGNELLIRAIDILKEIAPVDVFVVPGNHDTQTAHLSCMYLSAWYRNDKNVTVDTDPKTRKYREFGKCLIGFTHTDKERKRIFGCMQIEAREAWGRTKYQEWHGAHLHSEQVKEDMGVIVRNLSSVTGTDAWHYESGYVGSIAKSQSFIWDKEKGLTDILMTTIE